MTDDARLAKLSSDLDAALARINALQRGGDGAGTRPPLPTRVRAHVSRRGSLILNAALAGAAFAVAAGRLSLKRQHEADREAWAADRAALVAQAEAAAAEAADLRGRLGEVAGAAAAAWTPRGAAAAVRAVVEGRSGGGRGSPPPPRPEGPAAAAPPGGGGGAGRIMI